MKDYEPRDAEWYASNMWNDDDFIAAINGLEAENTRLRTRITELETFGDAAMLLEHAQMQARIEAAAGIGFMAHDFTVTDDIEHYFGKVDGWNACLLEFRAALGLGGE